MLHAEQNDRLTRVGPGTPAGDMLRRYWLPVAISGELTDRPLPVRVVGEDLVLYRGESGAAYLVARRCPHRGTAFTEGRVKGETIRCCYHGWLFDGAGQCLEQPGEPAGSKFAARVRMTAYPALDRYGMIWAYLGGGTPPALPPYDVLTHRQGARRVARATADCNFLQIVENSLDPVHTAVLHIGSHLENAYEEIPQFECENTARGARTIAWREGSGYRRLLEFVFPTMTRFTLPFMKPTVQMGFWVTPIDDTHSAVYFSWFLPIEPDMDKAKAAELIEHMERQFELNPADPFTLSSLVTRQDIFACESQGPIMDRTREWLGHSDRGVLMLRRAYLQAIEMVERGEDPPAILRDEPADTIVFDEVN